MLDGIQRSFASVGGLGHVYALAIDESYDCITDKVIFSYIQFSHEFVIAFLLFG